MKEFVPLKEKKYRCPKCGGALAHMGYCDPCKAKVKLLKKRSNRKQKFKSMGLKR